MKHTIEIDTIDKQTLYGMSLDDYKRYIEPESVTKFIPRPIAA